MVEVIVIWCLLSNIYRATFNSKELGERCTQNINAMRCVDCRPVYGCAVFFVDVFFFFFFFSWVSCYLEQRN